LKTTLTAMMTVMTAITTMVNGTNVMLL